jgi:serine/threonine protein kinase
MKRTLCCAAGAAPGGVREGEKKLAMVECDACHTANNDDAISCVRCGRMLVIDPTQPAPAATLAGTGRLAPDTLLKQRYRLISPVGAGGFGAVYRAEDTQLGDRLVAIKEMAQSGLNSQELAEATRAFQQEARLLGNLTHPNLPRIYDQFEEGGRWYLIMDFIEGETLEARLHAAPDGRLPLKEVVQLGLHLCDVLSYLHTRRPPIIFRDLKPANIMLTPEGHLYLIDFGIARHFKPGKARDTVALGSPGYAAPEQYGKATSHLSDIYSLGATLHHLLSGVDPSTNTPLLWDFAPLGPDIPAAMQRLIDELVQVRMDERPASAAEVKQRLQMLLDDLNAPTRTGALLLKSRDQVLLAALTHYKAQRYAEALAAFEQLLQRDPNNADIHRNKGRALAHLNRPQEALAAFDRAIQLDPNNPSNHRRKAVALHELKRYEEALAAFDRAIQLDPTHATDHINKGVMLTALKRYEEAVEAYDRAIQLDPQHAQTYALKAVILHSLKRNQEALIAHDQAIQLDPKNKDLYVAKGNLLFGLQWYEEALEVFDRALQLDPNNQEITNYKGLMLRKLNRHEEALALYERALLATPYSPDLLNQKGIVLANQGRHEEAIGCFDRALQLSPQAAIFFNKAYSLFELGRYQEATTACDRALRLNAQDTEALLLKQKALRRRQRF